MGFLSALFGGKTETPEEKQKQNEEKSFNIFKYDGVKASKMGQFDYAIRCFNEALKIHDDLETRDYLSQAYLRTGHFDEALKQMEHLVAAEPRNVALLLQKAHVYHLQENYQAMHEICEKAMAIDPTHAFACYADAQAQLGLHNPILAVARLTQALSLNPNMGSAMLLRSITLLQMGDVDGAMKDADHLLAANPGNEDVMMLKARAEYRAGHPDAAIQMYGMVIETNPFHAEAYRERGQVKYEQGNAAGAQEDMKKVLEINPESLAHVSGDFSAEGIENKVKQAYSFINPFGI